MRPVLLLALAACTAAPTSPEALFDPSGSFFDTPWPSDARRTPEGLSDWTGFPNPGSIPLINDYIGASGRQPGAATNAPLYLRFSGPILTDLLPPPEWSTSDASPVLLVNIDPRSPTFGRRVPFHWTWFEDDGALLPGHLLGLAPVAGFPLEPRTTYALIVREPLAGRSAAFERSWSGDGPWHTSLTPLREALPLLGVDDEDVAVATVFTTMDPTEPMENVARFLAERVTAPVFQPALERIEERVNYTVYRSNYTTPLFMTGTKPYLTEGQFQYRDDGLPEIQAWEPMRLSVVVPKDLTPPAAGWPVLVSLHGTGGTYRTFANSDSEFEIATWMADMGVVGVSIDLPLHGTRGTPDTLIDLHSFNVTNPNSALHIHRQAAADALYLLHGLQAAPAPFLTPEGVSVPIDPDRVSIIGHSQGGITTALALPWAGSMVRGAMMSGTGGLLAITAIERDADYDFAAMIEGLLQFEDGETLTELHPALALVQSLVEVTDPINYARNWYAVDGGFTGAKPTSFLLTSGMRDDMTPYRTSEALAAAAGAPFVGTRYSAAEGNLLRGLDALSIPVDGNREGWDGSTITAGLSQYDSGTHFVIFEDEDARDLTRDFVWSTLFDTPRIGPIDEP